MARTVFWTNPRFLHNKELVLYNTITGIITILNMSCILTSLLQSAPDGCFCQSGNPTKTTKTIGIIGRTLFEDFEPKGVIQSVVGNSITYKMVSDNRFMSGQEMKVTFAGLGGIVDFEKMFYSQFKKRKKLRK